jgi:chromosome segregation protein
MQSKYAQFIVISLRKITVEKADHIIGVTFQPATGMSEIVMKVDINSIEEQSKESQKISAEETRKVDVGASVN